MPSRAAPATCRINVSIAKEGKKMPRSRRGWIAGLVLIVIACVYVSAVIANGEALFSNRKQVAAIETPLPDASRDLDAPLGAAPIATTLARAKRHFINETLPVTGSLAPREEVVVGPEVDGLRIAEILADVGDHVEQGQVLARLDGGMLRTQLAQNNATIARTEAMLAQVKTSIAEAQANEVESADALKRTQALDATGTTTAAQLLTRETQAKVAAAKSASAVANLQIAEADYALAQALRSEVELKIARTELKAPAAGTISSRSARLGAVASITGEPLFRLIRNGEIEFDAEVPETVLPRIEPGQKVDVWLDGVNEAIDGRVRRVDPTVDKKSRLGCVPITLSPHPALRAGIFAHGNITVGGRQAITVPLSAVLFNKDGAYVELVTNNVVEMRNVKTGIKHGDNIEIVSGLTEGQEVVARAAAFLKAGDRITPVRDYARSTGRS
jgi:HlyD family secretion protein